MKGDEVPPEMEVLSMRRTIVHGYCSETKSCFFVVAKFRAAFLARKKRSRLSVKRFCCPSVSLQQLYVGFTYRM